MHILHAFSTSRPIKTAPLVSKIKYALCTAVTAGRCNKQEKHFFCILACFLFVYISFCLFICLFICFFFQRDAVVENIFELMHTAGKTEQGRRGAEEENPALRFHPQVSYSPSQIHCRQTQRVKYVEPLATFEIYCQNSQNPLQNPISQRDSEQWFFRRFTEGKKMRETQFISSAWGNFNFVQ